MYRETRWQTLEHLSSHFPRPNLIPDSSPASLLVLQVAFRPVSEATGGTKHGLLTHRWQLLSTASPLSSVLWHCTSTGRGPLALYLLWHGFLCRPQPLLGHLRSVWSLCRACSSGPCPTERRLLFSDLGVPSAGFHFYSLLFKLTDVYRQIPVKLQVSILLGSFLSPLILFLWPGKITILKSSEK